MTDDILDILCPERTISDDEALLLLRYAAAECQAEWNAFLYMRDNAGIELACNYLLSLPDPKLKRLAIVMRRLEREREERLHPQPPTTIAPQAKSVTMALSGSKVLNDATITTMEGLSLPGTA